MWYYWTYTRATSLTPVTWSTCRPTIYIEVCSFPPHCTHILQPLDDLPYAMLKRKFQKELISFNLQVAGEKLLKQQFFSVLIPTFSGAFQPEVIRKGFQNTGIYPLNQDAPKLKQLGPSQVYDKCKSNAVNSSFRHFRYWLLSWLPCRLCTNLFLFRWFKLTLKPPYSIVRGKLRLAIWDTSFWTFWLKFKHKGP